MASKLKTRVFAQHPALPLIVEPDGDRDIRSHRDEIIALAREKLNVVGALLFRGFDVGGVDAFESFARWFDDALLTYDYGSTPRSNISGRVYTSTEYPASQTIPLHNEMSYTREWPLKIWFYSIAVAPKGGETPIADSREVYRRIPRDLREKFSARGVMYVRNYRTGMDVPWQKVFGTQNKSDVEAFCRRSGIEFRWRSDDELSTRQVCQAVATHRQTGEPVWFNQAHLFHVSSLEPRLRQALLSIYKQEDLPRNALYGDGTPIAGSELDEIRRVLEEVKISFPWQPEDVLMLDNMLVAHGRAAFEGPRKVAVAMAEAFSAAQQKLAEVVP